MAEGIWKYTMPQNNNLKGTILEIQNVMSQEIYRKESGINQTTILID